MSLVRITSAALVAAALALGGAASADTIKSAAGATFDLTPPAGWKMANVDPSTLAGEDPSGAAGMLAIAVDEANTSKVLAGLDKLLASSATDIKWSKKKKPMTLNGMKGFSIDGSATVKGQPKLTTIVIVGGKKAGVLMFAAASKDYLAAHGADLLASFKSLKPAP